LPWEGSAIITEHTLSHHPYASSNAQLSLLKEAALYSDKLYILDPVGASQATIGSEHQARHALKLLNNAGILQTVTPAEILAKFAGLRLYVHYGHPQRGMAAR
jgi:hypothetical protein